MTDVIYTNQFTIQISDVVRLIMQDGRAGVQNPGSGLFEGPVVGGVVGEVVMSRPTARALRDLLVQCVGDDPVPVMETPNV